MTHTRRPLSLAVSFALGLGAALLVLLLGGSPLAAAAPAGAGDNQPEGGNICFARDDSATGTVYGSGDAGALRQAVAHAVTSDVVRLAGTCHGAVAQLGTTQTVAITKALSLVGGFTPADWNDSFPLSQPTTLDAQGLGRVITASADITIAELTVQHGISFGGDGGGIYAGGNLTTIGTVNILSNTTGYTPTVGAILNHASGTAAPVQPSIGGSGSGGGLLVNGVWENDYQRANIEWLQSLAIAQLTVQGNSAGNQGGGAFVIGNAYLNNFSFTADSAVVYGGGVNIVGTLDANNGSFVYDNSGFAGGALYTAGDVNMSSVSFLHNVGVDGAAWAPIYGTVNGTHLAFDSNAASGYGADIDGFGSNSIIIVDSTFKFGSAGIAGGAAYCVGVINCKFLNDTFLGYLAPEGSVLAVSNFGSLVDSDFGDITLSTIAEPVPGVYAPSAPITGSAISAHGVTVFVTDTIISGFPLAFETAQTGTIHSDYNLFGTTPVISGTNITTGTHSIVGNPLFSDDLGHLSAGSPAINHGIDVGINVDFDGNLRPSGAGFDIGAFEFQFPRLFLPLVER